MDINASTAMLKLATGEYPVYFQRVRQDFPEVSFPENPTEDCLGDYGFAVVYPTVRPTGDVVTEGTPTLIDGVYNQAWSVREFTPAELDVRLVELKRTMADQVLVLREKDLASGFIYQKDEVTLFGVQLRPEDRMNLLILKGHAQFLLAANATDTTVFRSTENVGYPLTPAELLAMCDAALVAGMSIYAVSWVLKDQIEAATTLAELPTIPATLIV
ncbi:hypothetical protein D3C81_331330 [compost metagenome]